VTVTGPLTFGAGVLDVDVDDIDRRLAKIAGQVEGLRRMTAGGRRCVEVLDQLAAARAALDAVLIVGDQVRAVVTDAAAANDLVDSVARLARR
jgi:DNA-binding FrmR family transcriptional regulator